MPGYSEAEFDGVPDPAYSLAVDQIRVRPMRRAGQALRSRQWGYVAALHFFWALGGSAGLAASAGAQLAAERPTWFVVGGLWGVGGLLLIGAALVVALARGSLRGRLRRLFVFAGGAVGLLLLARGVGIEILLITGAFDGNAALGPGQTYWTLVLWNPWFVVGGIAFGLASWASWKSGDLSRRQVAGRA